MSEKQYVEKMISLFGKEGKMFAMVGDTYNIYEFCEMLGTAPDIRAGIIANGEKGGFTVIRPDSGEPSEVVTKCLYILEKYYGSVKNAKGFRVLNNVRVIQGDGIDHATIRSILFVMELAGFSADNVAFGQGGALLQQVNRDTMRFAMKCSAIGVREYVEFSDDPTFVTPSRVEWRDVFKDPITDHGKKSKKGRVTLWQSGGSFESAVEQPRGWADKSIGPWVEALSEVYRDGVLVKEITFDEVRANARK